MGRTRLEAQKQSGTTEYVGYAMCFIILVIYTVIFTITYAKRLLYIMFLTVISPLVAVSYPLDKINDGKSQAFDLWLKEYIFNLLIQPFHLLLYTILVSMAFDLAGTNIIYSLVAIGFMIPAEKFLRKMFGFDKASTPGFLNGAAGAALTMSGIQSLAKFAKGPGGNSGKGSDAKGDGAKKNKIDFNDRSADSDKSMASLYDDMAGESNLQTGGALPEGMPPATGGTTTEEPTTPRDSATQRMSDLYDESYGTSDYDPHEREAMLRGESQPEGMNYSPEEFRQILKDTGYEEEEINRLMQENGYGQEQPQTSQETPNDEKGTKKHGVKDYMGARLTNFGNRVKSNYTKENMFEMGTKSIKSSVRTGSKMAMGIGGGIIGASTGIATGDLGNVGKNMTAGAFAGSAIGAGVSGRILNKEDGERNLHEEAVKQMYGPEYSKHLKEIKDKKFKQDRATRELYAREFGLTKKEDIDAVLDDANKYRGYGVTDNDVIIKAMQMNNGNKLNRADKKRIATAQMAAAIKNEKDLDAGLKRFSKTKGITKEQVKKMEEDVRFIKNM